MVEIRTARPEDDTAIQEVHTVAFGGPVEAKVFGTASSAHDSPVADTTAAATN